jgi:hypothetical protein
MANFEIYARLSQADMRFSLKGWRHVGDTEKVPSAESINGVGLLLHQFMIFEF